MRRLSLKPGWFALALMAPAVWLAAHSDAAHATATARSEVLDMDDKDRATVAKETMRQKKEAAANASNGNGSKSSSSSNCGSVDIGNSADNKKASARIADREKTVIVTGNVFNTASCGR